MPVKRAKKHLKYIAKSNETWPQFIRHHFIGGTGVVLNYLLFNLLVRLGLTVGIANTLNYLILFFVMFTLQKTVTYRQKALSWRQLALFLANTIAYYLLDTILLIVLIRYCQIVPLVSKLITLMFLTPFSFLSQKYLVFRDRGGERSL
jgi:putative flippase GtrA